MLLAGAAKAETAMGAAPDKCKPFAGRLARAVCGGMAWRVRRRGRRVQLGRVCARAAA